MSTTYTVTINHQGTTSTIQVPADKTILKAADEVGISFPSSCNAGVCTTCAAKITNGGKVNQSEGMGINPQLQKDGYVLLCVAYPLEDLEIITEQEDAVYEQQFGQFQK
jgi:ferredoxin